MFLRLLFLMTVVPAVELYLLIQIGSWLGGLETVLLIVITGMVGAAMAKREGLGVLRTIQDQLAAGSVPTLELAEGVLVLAGGILLMTPGVLTDAFGLALISPWTRRPLAARLKAWAKARSTVGTDGAHGFNVNIGAPQVGEASKEMADRFEHPVG
jgi:UPF0716 protein FxsA